jgi:hypothetical protein
VDGGLLKEAEVNIDVTRYVGTGLFFLFVLLSGVWTSRSGRPLNLGISTVHKLVSLGAGVFLIVTLWQRNQAVALNGMEWVAIVVTGLFFLGLVATGGLLSSEKALPAVVLRLHQVLPVLAIASTGVMLYLLQGR